MGEVAGGCVAGSVKYNATCPNPNEFRKTTCSATDATLVVRNRR